MFFVAIVLVGLPFTASECTFPAELTETWVTSTLSNLTFTSNTVGPFFQQRATMGCFIEEGSKYVLRSPAYAAGPAVFVDYTCLDLTKLTTTKFHYYELTPPNPDPIFNNERKVTHFNNTVVTVSDVCTVTPPTDQWMNSFMMKEGSLASSVVSFPPDVSGQFNVTMPGCEEGAFLDVCTDNTRLDFNHSLCGNSPFSDMMIFHAVYAETNNLDAYVTLYIEVAPPEPNNPFIPFSCMAVGLSSGNLSLTIAPGDCQDGQDSSNVTAPGVYMELHQTDSCDVPTTESPTTTASGTVTTAEESAVTNSSAITSTPAVVDGLTTVKASGSQNVLSVWVVLAVFAATIRTL